MSCVSQSEVSESAAGHAATRGDRVFRTLCRILADSAPLHRCIAAQALGRIRHPDRIEPLIEALRDEDEDVRTDACGVLAGAIDQRAAAPLLASLIEDPCADVKLAAIDGLARLRYSPAVPWLRRLAIDRGEEIAWDDSEFYETGWDDWVDVQTKAIAALAAIAAPEAVPDIVAAIDDEHGQDLTEVGFKALAELSEPGIEALVVYASDPDPRRRRRAAAALADLDGEAAAAAVSRALADPTPAVRIATARQLAARDPLDRRLVRLFEDHEPEVRADAVRLCGGDHADWMATLLDDPSETVQHAVLDLLAGRPGLLPADTVVERLRSWLHGTNPDLAAAAAHAIAAIAPDLAVDELISELTVPVRPGAVRRGAIAGLTTLGGKTAVQALIEVVGDDDRQIRLDAVAGLATIARRTADWPNPPAEALLAALRGELVPAPAAEEPKPEEPAAVEPVTDEASDEAARDDGIPTSTLQAILRGNAPSPRQSAISESAAPGVALTPADIERLALAQRRLEERRPSGDTGIAPHRDVRHFAARLAGDLAHPDVARELAAALRDDDRDLRAAATDSLARIGAVLSALPDQAIDTLREMLTSRESDLRLIAIRALAGVGCRDLADDLAGLLGDEDGFVRAEAIGALSRLRALPPDTTALLADAEPAVRLAAADALADGGGGEAVERLVGFAFEFGGQHRREAGRLLRRLDPATASDRFLDVLDDQDRLRWWQVAIEALEELHGPISTDDGARKE